MTNQPIAHSLWQFRVPQNHSFCLIKVSTLLVQQQLTLTLPEAVAKVACGCFVIQNWSKHVLWSRKNYVSFWLWSLALKAKNTWNILEQTIPSGLRENLYRGFAYQLWVLEQDLPWKLIWSGLTTLRMEERFVKWGPYSLHVETFRLYY